MENSILWSLRLGFSSREASEIEKLGIKAFVKKSFLNARPLPEPEVVQKMPRNMEDIVALRKKISSEPEGKKKWNDIEGQLWSDIGTWWIKEMAECTYPLVEKMTLFWHNHFVVNSKLVYVPYYTYLHNNLLRQNAFGNFRELTKKVIRSNAMILYLNNDKNTKNNYNENLSRELLELFTLGIGNYSENDIQGGAMGLAGLTTGKDEGAYNPKNQNDAVFEYLGMKGAFKSDQMVDIIFKQKNAPYLITRKILKWFIYDNPPEKLVVYYGDFLKKHDYEIQPLLLKIFSEEFKKPTSGSLVKDPTVFILQCLAELEFKDINYKNVQRFLRNQNMAPYEQPSVKGWNGGRA